MRPLARNGRRATYPLKQVAKIAYTLPCKTPFEKYLASEGQIFLHARTFRLRV